MDLIGFPRKIFTCEDFVEAIRWKSVLGDLTVVAERMESMTEMF